MDGVAQKEAEWVLKEVPEGFSLEDDRSEYPPILRLLLAQRGLVDDEEIEGFLHPRLRDLSDPFLLPDMGLAVERIFRAVDGGEEIAIFGDYDVDGITSVTILKKILECYGANPRPFIPIRGEEGYGLSDAAVAIHAMICFMVLPRVLGRLWPSRSTPPYEQRDRVPWIQVAPYIPHFHSQSPVVRSPRGFPVSHLEADRPNRPVKYYRSPRTRSTDAGCAVLLPHIHSSAGAGPVGFEFVGHGAASRRTDKLRGPLFHYRHLRINFRVPLGVFRL